MKNMIARYRGNYIAEMRKNVGHAPLMVIGCGVIIENEKREILLQKRRDHGCWALLGGSMEIGEKFIETVKREAFEEAGIEIKERISFLRQLRIVGKYKIIQKKHWNIDFLIKQIYLIIL